MNREEILNSLRTLSDRNNEYLKINLICRKKDEYFFKQGESSDSIFLLLHGEIQLTKLITPDNEYFINIKANEFFGLYEILEGSSRKASAKAIEDSMLIEVSFVNKEELRNYWELLHQSSQQEINKKPDLTFEPVNDFKRDYSKQYNCVQYKNISVVFFNLNKAMLINAAIFKRIVLDVIHSGTQKLILDFQICKFIDSTFLGVLVTISKALKDVNGHLRLVLSNEIKDNMLFTITNVDKVFDIYYDLKDALQSFEPK